MSPRLIRLAPIVLLCFGLSLSAVQAQSKNIQLCGFTQFVDFVIIDGTVNDSSRLVIPSSWIQIVPHTYTLMGSGPFIRDPLLTDPNLFIGGFVLADTSAAFQGNHACTLDARILDTTTNPALPTFAGTGALFCFGGTMGTFQVTLQLQMTTCDEPGFPGNTSVLSLVPPGLTPSTLEKIMTRAQDEQLMPASQAPNEYGVR